MIAELVDGRENELTIWGRKELMDDIRQYTFSRARCVQGDLLAKERAQRGQGMHVFRESTIENWTLSNF